MSWTLLIYTTFYVMIMEHIIHVYEYTSIFPVVHTYENKQFKTRSYE